MYQNPSEELKGRPKAAMPILLLVQLQETIPAPTAEKLATNNKFELVSRPIYDALASSMGPCVSQYTTGRAKATSLICFALSVDKQSAVTTKVVPTLIEDGKERYIQFGRRLSDFPEYEDSVNTYLERVGYFKLIYGDGSA